MSSEFKVQSSGFRVRVLLITLSLLTDHWLFAQGSLTPPGAPAPTFKTLEQVEPRTPITNLPYTISAPGSYYLVTNLTGVAGGTNGISIEANDVTVDLSGFVLAGVPGSGTGVIVPSEQNNLWLRNGVVRDWGDSGVDGWNAAYSLFEKLRVSNNAGIGLQVGPGCTVNHCTASANGGRGIGVRAGSTVSDCAATANGSDGILGDADCVIIACTATGNTNAGIFATEGGVLIKDCTASSNGSRGIEANEATIVNCTVRRNALDGINVVDGSLVLGNTCAENGFGVGDGAGIRSGSGGNRIEGNNLTFNDRGIHLLGGGNLVIKNSAKFNPNSTGSSNYVIAAGNSLGEILVVTNATSTVIITNANPWANFSY